MPGNSLGQMLRITTAGESHGPANIVIIDGCPPGIPLQLEDLVEDLMRRKPGQSNIVSARKESEIPEILSGVFEGKTTGTSIAILIRNQDAQSQDYDAVKEIYRPGHADFTYDQKYGIRDHRGGGRSSARETVARVAAGVIAKKIIASAFSGKVFAYVTQIGDVKAQTPDLSQLSLRQIEMLPDGSPNLVRCPDPEAAVRMKQLVEQVREESDSIGGVAEVAALNIPAGLGEPVFDKLKADLAKALFSIPAVMGVEYGVGFACAMLRGSQSNDALMAHEQHISFGSNQHGGMLGGISSGMPILLRVAVKAPSSIAKPQQTTNRKGESLTLQMEGRHDPCVLPRFVPIAEAMVALVLADHWLRFVAQTSTSLQK